MDIPKCRICGKEYILNPFALDKLPPGFASHIKYIPACECFEKFKDKELEEAERKRPVSYTHLTLPTNSRV